MFIEFMFKCLCVLILCVQGASVCMLFLNVQLVCSVVCFCLQCESICICTVYLCL